MSHRTGYRLRIGVYEFIVFAELGKFRFLGESMFAVLYDDELEVEWKANLAKLKKIPALFPDDTKRLREAAKWLKRKGGDE